MIQVDIVAKENISSEAKKASDAMGKLAAQEQRVQGATSLVAKETGAITKAIQAADKAELKLLADTEKEHKAAKALAATKDKAAQKEAAEGRKAYEAVQKLKAGNLAGALELSKGAVIAQAVTMALLAAGVAAVGLGAALGVFAIKANDAKNSALGIMNVLTGGHGAEALAQVDSLAKSLGMRFEDARDGFIKFRQAGADNAVSAALLKLQADLNTVDGSGKLAAEAVTKVLAHKGKDGALDIAAAKDEMALLAKQAGVAGDGAAAAKARFGTLAGALASLDNSKTEALEKIGAKLAPVIDEVAGKVAKMVDAFLNSPKGAAALDMVSNALIGMVHGVESAVSIAGSFIGFLQEWSPLLKAIGIGVGIAGLAFAVTLVPALLATASAAAAALVPILVAASPFIALAAAATLVYLALTHIPEIVTYVKGLFESFGKASAELGTNLVNGIITGISGAAGALYDKVAGVAQGAMNAFKNVLGIHSDSKVFTKLGQFTMGGLNTGIEDNAPDARGVAAAMIPEPAAVTAASKGLGLGASPEATPQGPGPLSGAVGAGPATVGAVGAPSGSSPIFVTFSDGAVRIDAHGGDAKELARSFMREVQLEVTRVNESRGTPSGGPS